MKVCTKCHIEKDESEFHKHKETKSGRHSCCKTCHKNRMRKYYIENKERIKRINKIYVLANKEKVNERKRKWKIKTGADKKYYEKNKDKILPKVREYSREFRKNNKELSRKRVKASTKKNPIPKRLATQRFRINNKGKVNAWRKEWGKKNPSKVKSWRIRADRKAVEELKPRYLKKILLRHGCVSKEEIHKMPFLIDKKKLDILIKRSDKLIKQNKKQ